MNKKGQNMASENETVSEIVKEMRGPYYKMGRSNARLDHDMMGYMSFIANRIEAAHRREVAELRECLKDVRRELCKECRSKGFKCKKSEPCVTVLNIDITLHNAPEGGAK